MNHDAQRPQETVLMWNGLYLAGPSATNRFRCLASLIAPSPSVSRQGQPPGLVTEPAAVSVEKWINWTDGKGNRRQAMLCGPSMPADIFYVEKRPVLFA